MKDAARHSVWQELAGGLRQLLGADAPRPETPFAALLDLLVWGGRVQQEVREIEADAPASVGSTDAQESRVARDELAAARADLPQFERALRDAWQRSDGTEREVTYDSADPVQDSAVGALIRYLVTNHLGTVRSEEQPTTDERAPQQYRYYLATYWESLFAVADFLGLDLRAALEGGQAS